MVFIKSLNMKINNEMPIYCWTKCIEEYLDHKVYEKDLLLADQSLNLYSDCEKKEFIQSYIKLYIETALFNRGYKIIKINVIDLIKRNQNFILHLPINKLVYNEIYRKINKGFHYVIMRYNKMDHGYTMNDWSYIDNKKYIIKLNDEQLQEIQKKNYDAYIIESFDFERMNFKEFNLKSTITTVNKKKNKKAFMIFYKFVDHIDDFEDYLNIAVNLAGNPFVGIHNLIVKDMKKKLYNNKEEIYKIEQYLKKLESTFYDIRILCLKNFLCQFSSPDETLKKKILKLREIDDCFIDEVKKGMNLYYE